MGSPIPYASAKAEIDANAKADAASVPLLRDPNVDLGDRPPYEPPAGAPGHERYVIHEAWTDDFPPPWPVWNQGRDQTCTAFAAAGAVMCHELREAQRTPYSVTLPVGNDPSTAPSALFIYFLTKYRGRTLAAPREGVFVHEAFEVVETFGVCRASTWKTLGPEFQDVSRWNDGMFQELVDKKVLDEAAKALPFEFASLGRDDRPRDEGALLACLQAGQPFTICVYQFNDYVDHERRPAEYRLPEPTARYIEAPDPNGRMLRRAHTMLVVGYDTLNDPHSFVARDAYGPTIGARGYHWLPFEWATDPRHSFGLCTLRRAP